MFLFYIMEFKINIDRIVAYIAKVAV